MVSFDTVSAEQERPKPAQASFTAAPPLVLVDDLANQTTVDAVLYD